MGNDQPGSKQPTQKPIDMTDAMLEMKMTAKRFECESKRAEKEKIKQMKKAKDALKKGNEEGCKLFLANAANYQKESLNCLKMSHKIEAIATQIKTNQNQTEMTKQLNKLTPLLQQQTQQIPFEKLYADMQKFDTAMDDILVQGKIVNEITNKQTSDTTTDMAVDQMLIQLKNEFNTEINHDFGMNQPNIILDLKTPEQMQQQQQQQQLPQKY